MNLDDERRENDEEWGRRGDRAYSRFTEKPKSTAFRWLAGLLVTLLLLGAVFGLYGLVCGYGGEAARVAGVGNVKAQNTAILDDYTGMQQGACNALAAKRSAHGEGDPTLIETPNFAYAAKYRELKQDYDRRLGNLYEAQAVRKLRLPSNLRSLPKVAPPLSVMERRADC